VDRFCYCDQPIDANCDDCASDCFCMNHPRFYCSGSCGRWIHCIVLGTCFTQVLMAVRMALICPLHLGMGIHLQHMVHAKSIELISVSKPPFGKIMQVQSLWLKWNQVLCHPSKHYAIKYHG
jgi:hypothetical protein